MVDFNETYGFPSCSHKIKRLDKCLSQYFTYPMQLSMHLEQVGAHAPRQEKSPCIIILVLLPTFLIPRHVFTRFIPSFEMTSISLSQPNLTNRSLHENVVWVTTPNGLHKRAAPSLCPCLFYQVLNHPSFLFFSNQVALIQELIQPPIKPNYSFGLLTGPWSTKVLRMQPGKSASNTTFNLTTNKLVISINSRLNNVNEQFMTYER